MDRIPFKAKVFPDDFTQLYNLCSYNPGGKALWPQVLVYTDILSYQSENHKGMRVLASSLIRAPVVTSEAFPHQAWNLQTHLSLPFPVHHGDLVGSPQDSPGLRNLGCQDMVRYRTGRKPFP